MGKEMGDPSGDVEKTGLNAVLLSSGELEGLGKKGKRMVYSVGREEGSERDQRRTIA